MNAVILALFLGALLVIQVLIGGTRLVFSLPAYAVLAVAGVLAAFSWSRTRPRLPWPALASTLALGGYVLWRAWTSPVPYLAQMDFYMVLGCLLAYFLGAHHLATLRHRAWFAGVLLVLVAVSVAIGVRQFAVADNFMAQASWGLERAPLGKRASGLLAGPNVYAGLLETLGALALALACWAKWRPWLRFLVGYLALCCYVGVALSGSRGGYLSAAFSLAIFAVLSWLLVRAGSARRGLLFLVVGTFLILGGIVGFFALTSQSVAISQRLQALEEQIAGTGQADARVSNWAAAFQQYDLAPAFGTGAGTHLYYGRLFRDRLMQSDPVHAHSDYLELLAEYGWVGAAVLGLFVIVHLGYGVHSFRRALREERHTLGLEREDSAAWIIGILAAASALLVHSVVDFNFHVPGHALLFATLFGLLAARAPRVDATPPRLPLDAGRLLLPLLGIFMLVRIVPIAHGEYLVEKLRRAVVKRDLEQALAVGPVAAQKAPENPFAHFYLGEASRSRAVSLSIRSLRRPYYQAAIPSYRRSLELFPQNSYAWLRLGQALDGVRDFSEAEKAYSRAIELDPKSGMSYAYLANHFRQRGREFEAERQLLKAQSFLPTRRLQLGETGEQIWELRGP